MISYVNRRGNAYGVVNLILDDDSDVLNLPINCGAGSTAYVIDTSDYYMLNNKKQWKKQKRTFGGEGGSDSPEPDTDTIIYDGGEV